MATPTVSINVAFDGGSAHIALQGDSGTATFTFSEIVTGFTLGDIQQQEPGNHGVVISDLVSTDGGRVYTATVTPEQNTQSSNLRLHIDAGSVINSQGEAGPQTTTYSNYFHVRTILTPPTVSLEVVSDTINLGGDTAPLNITFSEVVTGFDIANVLAENATISNLQVVTANRVFTATLTPNNFVNDNTNRVTFDQSTVTDSEGTPGSGIAQSNNYGIVTGTPPHTTSFIVADTDLGVGDTTTVNIAFNEVVTGFDIANLIAENAIISNLQVIANNREYQATLTPNPNIVDPTNRVTFDRATVVDSEGTPGLHSVQSNNYAINTVVILPTVVITLDDTALTVNDTALVTFTWNEVVTGFTNADISLDNATLSPLQTVTAGRVFRATLTPSVGVTVSTNTVRVDQTGVQDLDSTAGVGIATSVNYTVATIPTPPTVTLEVTDTELTIGETTPLTITFNEAVTGFTLDDLVAQNASVSNLQTIRTNQGYRVTLTPDSNVSDTTNRVSFSRSRVQDSEGTSGTGIAQSNNYSVQTVETPPTVDIDFDGPTTLGVGDTTDIRFTFSEVVQGFTKADITVIPNASLGTLQTSDNIVYTITLTPNPDIADPTNILSLNMAGVTDAEGTPGVGIVQSPNYAINTITTPPGLVITIADTLLTQGETTPVTFTFTEPVTGFTQAAITIDNATLGALQSDSAGRVFTATLTPTDNLSDTTNRVRVNLASVQDNEGTAGVGIVSSLNYQIETTITPPTASIVLSDYTLTTGETAEVTFTFNEAVNGFRANAITAPNGSLSGLVVTDGLAIYTATYTPDVNVQSVANQIVLDLTTVQNTHGTAGEGNALSPVFSINTILTPPTLAIRLSDAEITEDESSTIFFDFSEIVTGFSLDNVTAPSGMLSAFTSLNSGQNYTAIFTPFGGVTDNINTIQVDMAGVRDVHNTSGTGVVNSGNYTVNTAEQPVEPGVSPDPLDLGEHAGINLYLINRSVQNGRTYYILDQSESGTVGAGDPTSFTELDALLNPGDHTMETQEGMHDGTDDARSVIIGDYAIILPTNAEFADLDLAPFEINNARYFNVANYVNNQHFSYDVLTSAVAPGFHTFADHVIFQVINIASVQTPPTVTNITLSDNELTLGDTALVTIQFNEVVTGVIGGTVTADNATHTVPVSTDGGTTYTTTITPNAGVSSDTNKITVNLSTVRDSENTPGVGTETSGNYTIDTVRTPPTATMNMSDTSLVLSETSLVTIQFNEPVTGFVLADVVAPNGVMSNLQTLSNNRYRATFTPNLDVVDSSSTITYPLSNVQDAEGTPGEGTLTGPIYSVSTLTTPPTLDITLSETSVGIGDNLTATFTFSEVVSGFVTTSILAPNGVISGLGTSNGRIYTAVFTPNENTEAATNVISVPLAGIRDGEGTAGIGTAVSPNYIINTLTSAPTVVITLTNLNLGIGDTGQVVFTWNEIVTGFTAADITTPNASLSNLTTIDGGRTYTATITPNAGIADATNKVLVTLGGVQDEEGTAGVGTTESPNYVVDTVTTPPELQSISILDAVLTVSENTSVIFAFNEAVTGFTLADITAPNATLSAPTSEDGGVTYTSNLEPHAEVLDATNFITVNLTGVTDIDGTPGVGTVSSGNYAINTRTTPPTVTITLPFNTLGVGDTGMVTIQFNEPVTGFTLADMSAQNATLSDLHNVLNNQRFTATITPDTEILDASNRVFINLTGVVDSDGTPGVGTDFSENYAVNTITTPPTLVIALSDLDLGVDETATVIFTFNEPVQNFSIIEISVTNGGFSPLIATNGNRVFTTIFTPLSNTHEDTNRISVDLANVQDSEGTPGVGVVQSELFAIDTRRTPPVLSIVLSDYTLTQDETAEVTFTFSEIVTGFLASAITSPGGTLSGIVSTDGGRVYTATLTPTPNITDASNRISVVMTGIRDNEDTPGVGTQTSPNYAVNTEPVATPPTLGITLSRYQFNVGETALVIFSFNEVVAGFTNADITVSGGSITPVASNTEGSVYTATFTPDASLLLGSNAITVNMAGVVDTDGTLGIGIVSSPNYAIDTTVTTSEDTDEVVHTVWAEAAKEMGRKPIEYVELSLDRCTLDYGNSPCTARLALENILPNGQSLSNGWTPTSMGVSQVADPENRFGMVYELVSTSITNPRINRTQPVIIGDEYSFSFYARGDTQSVIQARVGVIRISINLNLGTMEVPDGITAGIVEDLGKWRRYYITFTATNANVFLRLTHLNTMIGQVSQVYAPQLRRGSNPGKVVLVNRTAEDKQGARKLCFNTFNTCQDPDNYTLGSTSLLFITRDSVFSGKEAYPALQSISYTPTEIEPGKGISKRAKVTVKLADFTTTDVTVDPYYASRHILATDKGTFFGKLLARNTYHKGRRVRVQEGYESLIGAQVRDYVVENISMVDSSGNVSMVAKDFLDLANNTKTQCPTPVAIGLEQAMLIDSTTIKVATDKQAETLAPNVPSIVNPRRYVIIEAEIIQLPEVIQPIDGLITNCLRGQLGTKAKEHAVEANIQPIYVYRDTPVWLAVYILLRDFAGLDEQYVDLAGWQEEYNNALTGFTVNAIIEKPTGIASIINEILKISFSEIWWDELAQQVRWGTQYQYRDVLPTVYNDDEHFLAGSLRVREKSNLHVTRVSSHYGVVNPLTDLQESHNYTFSDYDIALGLEGEAAYNQHKLYTIYNRWQGRSHKNNIALIRQRILDKYSRIPEEISFELDARHVNGLVTGSVFDVETRLILDEYGEPKRTRFQVISAKPLMSGTKYGYKALAFFQTAVGYTPGGIDTRETITVDIRLADNEYTYGQVYLITFDFSKEPVGFGIEDIDAPNLVISRLERETPTIYTATIAPVYNRDISDNILTVNLAGVTDTAGVSGVGSSTSSTYRVYSLPAFNPNNPAHTLHPDNPDNNPVTLGIEITPRYTITNTGKYIVYFNFSRDINGFTNADISIPNATLSEITPNGFYGETNKQHFIAELTPDDNVFDTTNVITVNLTGVTDEDGTAGVGTATSENYIIDTRVQVIDPNDETPPTLDPDRLDGDAFSPTVEITLSTYDLSPRNSTYWSVQKVQVRFDFSQVITGFNISDITAPNGVLTDPDPEPLLNEDGSVSGLIRSLAERYPGRGLSPDVYTLEFTATDNVSDNSNRITYDLTNATNAAGVVGVGTASSTNYTIDTVTGINPHFNVHIELSRTHIGVGETAQVIFTFNEVDGRILNLFRTTGFTLDDVTVGSGILTAPTTTDNNVFRSVFIPTENVYDLENVITVDMTGITTVLQGISGGGQVGIGTRSSVNYTVDTVNEGGGVFVPGTGITSYTIDSNRTNFNLFNTLGGPIGSIGTISNPFIVTINAGVVISASFGNPAFTLGNIPPGSYIRIINNGSIYGHAGKGGTGSGIQYIQIDASVPGQVGDALLTCQGFVYVGNSGLFLPPDHAGSRGGTSLQLPGGGHNITIDNSSGTIYGGGNGGRGGYVRRYGTINTGLNYILGSGGGGGQGTGVDSGGSGGQYVEVFECGNRIVFAYLAGLPGVAGSVTGPGTGGGEQQPLSGWPALSNLDSGLPIAGEGGGPWGGGTSIDGLGNSIILIEGLGSIEGRIML